MAKEMLGCFVKVRASGKSNAYSLREQCMNAGAESAVTIHDTGPRFIVKALFRGECPDFLNHVPWIGRVSREAVIFDAKSGTD